MAALRREGRLELEGHDVSGPPRRPTSREVKEWCHGNCVGL
jgi:hypothetical protein